jgi:hypothetical protein
VIDILHAQSSESAVLMRQAAAASLIAMMGRYPVVTTHCVLEGLFCPFFMLVKDVQKGLDRRLILLFFEK